MASLKGPGEARTYDGSTLRIGIIHARWNAPIINSLLAGTRAALLAAGVRPANVVTQSVPGSYELPLAARSMYVASQTQAANSAVAGIGGSLVGAAADLLGASTGDLRAEEEEERRKKEEQEGLKSGEEEASTQPFDAIIAVGALIKGGTMHFEYISDAVSHGLMRVQVETGCPLVFGLLTLLTEEQGLERAGLEVNGKKGHNHGEDWGAAAVELGLKRKGWAEGRFID